MDGVMPTEAEIKAAEDAAKAADKANDHEDDETDATGLSDAAKAILKKNRQAARDAAKAAKTANDELTALKAKQAEADAAKAKAEEAEALKRGEHETVIAAKTTENETLKAELDAAKKRLDAIDAMSKKRIEDGLADLPEDQLVHDPGAEAPLETRLAWFEKATAEAAKRDGKVVKFPGTPREQKTTAAQRVEQTKQELMQSRKYGI